MNIRERFEEIWPMPDRIEWDAESGKYEPPRYMSESEFDWLYSVASEHSARLDTFTRCQETTAIHLSLIEEMLQEIESCHADLRSENWYVPRKSALLDRAKQIMEQKK